MITLIAFAVAAQAADVNVKSDTLDAAGKKIKVSYYKAKKDDEHGDRFEIKVDGKTALDLKAEVCIPEENVKDPGCDPHQVQIKKGSLLEIRDEFDASSVDQASSTYLYRWQNGAFSLIGATAEHSSTGQVELLENSKVDINYSTGKAVSEEWTESDKGSSKHKTKTCTLKDTRKNETLAKFTGFNIDAQVVCK